MTPSKIQRTLGCAAAFPDSGGDAGARDAWNFTDTSDEEDELTS
ncbi:hypothetical protein ACQFX6_32225 [Streptomyces sp. DSM 41987]